MDYLAAITVGVFVVAVGLIILGAATSDLAGHSDFVLLALAIGVLAGSIAWGSSGHD